MRAASLRFRRSTRRARRRQRLAGPVDDLGDDDPLRRAVGQKQPDRPAGRTARRRAQIGRLTQEEVTDRLTRPQSFVATYEGGERRIDVIEFIDVVRAVERDPREVFEALVRATGTGTRRRRRGR